MIKSYFYKAVSVIKEIVKLPRRVRAWWRNFISSSKKAACDLLLTAVGIVLTDPIILFLICGILLYRYLHQLFDVPPQYE